MNADALAFFENAGVLPEGEDTQSVHGWFQAMERKAEVMEAHAAIAALLCDPRVKSLLRAVFTHSPFLSRVIVQYPGCFAELCRQGPEYCLAALQNELEETSLLARDALMRHMRVAKSKASMIIGLADIMGLWGLERVTQAMTGFAQACVEITLGFLLRQMAEKGELALKHPAYPQKECGVFVLAMGKMGAYELNYSSDIDLVIFFDRETVQYTGTRDVQQGLAKLARDMVSMLQERTAEGYVFRVDLRLRPDPASTPPAISVAGAMTYYETVGQNWERAAFIKARPVAGDIELGQRFLQQLIPFIWRKHLDFAAIDDIQSIKRQMDEKTGGSIHLPGHNVKTGIGGIREIEFFAQIHQLIWGGRMPALRGAGTCETIATLAANALVEQGIAQRLVRSYHFLRKVEHRLQMVDDQQTHAVPISEETRGKFALFAGFTGREAFESALLSHLSFVHTTFAGAFRGRGSLSGDEGKLSFTGVENDPQTLETLAKMGYRNPAAVSELIQGWHRGTRRATRTKRARELITELTPTLLKALASTVHPDQAFLRFDEFLAKLPAGVQIFSLFTANPELLELIAVIMGSAPALAEHLSKNPQLLDVVLTVGFYQGFSGQDALWTEISVSLMAARDFEDEIDIIRRFKNEKQFQIGVQLIIGRIDAMEAGGFLSDTAEICLKAMLHRVEVNFALRHPELLQDKLAIIVLGRLGARELTFGSDIDMVFVYESDAKSALLPASHSVYNKLSQRFISAVTALTREGRLYEIDTRLRPSGGDGALAVSVASLGKYLRESAWTFELMAFTRARTISGNPALQESIQAIVGAILALPRAKAHLAGDIAELRRKITHEFGSDNPWNIKYVHGGLMDLDFLAQYWVLMHASANPGVAAHSTGDVFRRLLHYKVMDKEMGQALVQAHGFLNSLLALIRLCGGEGFDGDAAPEGLRRLIASRMKLADFEAVKAKLLAMLAVVKAHFEEAFGAKK